MHLPAAGREYAHWTVDGLPDDYTTGLEITFDDGTTWVEPTVVGTTATVLLAGPDATTNPAGTVVLALGRTNARARLTDAPEVILRPAGAIDVT